MIDIFISFLNMSITASYVILAVLLLRLFLKGIPKKYSYALWSVVGFRLVCPVSFESVFSLFSLKPFDMTKAQRINENSLTYVQKNNASKAGELIVGIPEMNSIIANDITQTATYEKAVNPVLLALTVIWFCGIIALIVYSAIKFIKLNKVLKTAVKSDGNVKKSENISSPFIVGIIRPKIYVPSGIDDDYTDYVLAHERYHIKRFDNLIKLIAYCLLVLHWFNPFVWLAFYLMTKDMEMSCDEAVISKNSNIKKAYSTALLSFASDKKFPAPSPISFSENGVKARIKNVLHYKKPNRIILTVAIILCVALLAACAANPKTAITKQKIVSVSGATSEETNTSDIEKDYNDALAVYNKLHIPKNLNDLKKIAKKNGASEDDIAYLDIKPKYYYYNNDNYSVIVGTSFGSDDGGTYEAKYIDYYGESKNKLNLNDYLEIRDKIYIGMTIKDFYSAIGRDYVYFLMERSTGETLIGLYVVSDSWMKNIYVFKNNVLTKIQDTVAENYPDLRIENGYLMFGASKYVKENFGNKITFDDIKRIYNSEKAPILSDFSEYEHIDTGSGLYCYIMPVDDGGMLFVNATGLNDQVMSIQCSPSSETQVSSSSGQEDYNIIYEYQFDKKQGIWYIDPISYFIFDD